MFYSIQQNPLSTVVMQKQLLVMVLGMATGLTACQSDTTSPAAAMEAPKVYMSMEGPQPSEPSPVSLVETNDSAARPVPAGIQTEQIRSGMLVVEGLPSEQLSVAQLVRQLGQPDSVARGVVECGSTLDGNPTLPGDMWYYDGTQYEVADKQAVLATMDVRSGRFHGKLGKLLLNQRTTLQDMARVFPKAAQTVGPAAESAAFQQVSFTYLLDNGQTADGELWLIFDQGKLIKVENWFPC
ncbi:hypothetical protein [Hymenobacter lapidiphilus]|uniref:Uncharacterized protein n=1 Tax=Hymenobacter lapidiphilus TaxID=2608003 RepID=A0A7Y7PRT9_9BACT|nr:hypothetical protein [Hymenobacter lapidiphilus]NVO32522.1 hypothetical protein [Hymenobacter lapidiphilus]